MTVQELIDKLSELPPSLDVVIPSQTSGTVLCENVEEEYTIFSESTYVELS